MKMKANIKRILALVLIFALMSTMAACGSSSSESSSTPTDTSESVDTPAASTQALFSNPGTYTATVAGRNGDVTVTATFSENKIEDIQIDSEETPTIGVTAMDTMIAAILDGQTLNVDAVSGATISSEAMMNALLDCVAQAGGDLSALSSGSSTGSESASYVTEADIIVVGAGGAGLTAALTASQEGASVILLEKSSVVGGNTLCATMGINAAESQVQKDADVDKTVEEFVEQQLNNPDAQENLVRALCSQSGEVIDWLTGLGVKFEVGGNSDFMLLAEEDGSTSVTMVNAIYRAVQKSDVNLYLNTEVTALVADDQGRVTGVTAINTEGETLTFTGKAVVLATGGFGQNQELLAQVRPDLANAITDEIAPTTGQGLLMAQAVGADTVNLDSIQLFPHVIPDYGLIVPFNIPGGFSPDAIYVNNSAQRFTQEGFEVSEAILSQDNGEVYCIFTEDALNDTMRDLMGIGYVVSGGSPEELADKLGLDGDALADTISQWNADCAAGADSQFGRTDNLNALEGTLYGYRFGVGAHYFMGGILIDETTRVINTAGEPIEGLYAAGEVTGGFHGTYRVDGCGTADAFVFGRIAGLTTAAYVK